MTRLPLPITVIGGYLGAGKTTLLNHLLKNAGGLKIAVLVNDFGALNIDASLIETQGAGTIALSNGCVCCTISDSLGETLDEVAGWPSPPDHIVVEASGVANPAKIALYGSDGTNFTHDSTLVVVDGETIRQKSKDKFVGRLVVDQLPQADIIVLNKTDLLAPGLEADVKAWIKARAPETTIISTCQAALPTDFILGTDALKSSKSTRHSTHLHHPEFWTWAFEEDVVFDTEKLENFLRVEAGAIARAKGFLKTAAGDTILLQLVGTRISFSPPPAGTHKTGLVFIGTGPFNSDVFAERLANCYK